jgi:hypothetical protein
MVTRKSKYNKKNTPRIFFGTAVVIVVALIGYGLWKHYHTSPLGVNVATHSSPADNNFNNTRKSSSTPAQTLDNGPTASSSATSNISLTVTRAAIFDGSLEVGTLVNGATTGTCTLDVSQTGQQTITQSEQVILSNNSYACPVFNVPLSHFPNQNDWNVSVTLTSNGATTTASWANNPVDFSAESN